MNQMPYNCNECNFEYCHLPIKKNTYRDEIKKEYEKKRHKDCPLMEMPESD